jgi:hypothetical protein
MKTKKQLMSLRQYATHRGVTLRAVQKAIETGRIATDTDGKLDPKVCDLTWDAATDPSKQRKTERVRKHADKFAEAKASREDYSAKLAQLKFEQQCGLLVDAETVKKRAFENARALRDALLNLPNQLANDLASENDPIKVANILTIEINNCLEELAAPRIEAAKAGLGPVPADIPKTKNDEEAENEDE